MNDENITILTATPEDLLANGEATIDHDGQEVIHTGLYEWSDKTLHDQPEEA